MKHPILIQGGMGVAVSNWRLARAVSIEGHLGVVSGTMIDTVLVRRLQDGDPGGDIRRALKAFPDQIMAERILDRYFIPGGKRENQPYKTVPMQQIKLSVFLTELLIVANFVEVFLAKEIHNGLVGINYLEKVQLPTLPSLYGAMLAGVDYILMGAGIPKAIPGILDSLTLREKVSMKLAVENTSSQDKFEAVFDPSDFPTLKEIPLRRPSFFAVISSNLLANVLAKKSSGKVDGFVIENHSAGGHNAPPRGAVKYDDNGEPVYGSRDTVDLEAIKKLNIPFWLAGSYGNEGKLQEALDSGANGIQIGTPFAYCDESGFPADVKEKVIEKIKSNDLTVYTDMRASSSNYPFKVIALDDTMSDSEEYEQRPRKCDLGYLRNAYKKDDGTIGYRCPGEPVESFTKKGGDIEDTEGRKCLCNGLLAAVDYPQVQSPEYTEVPLFTAGKGLSQICQFLNEGKSSYTARDVIQKIMGKIKSPHYCF